jgi:hypothetical protein
MLGFSRCAHRTDRARTACTSKMCASEATNPFARKVPSLQTSHAASNGFALQPRSAARGIVARLRSGKLRHGVGCKRLLGVRYRACGNQPRGRFHRRFQTPTRRRHDERERPSPLRYRSRFRST